jgi:hypothetical protein
MKLHRPPGTWQTWQVHPRNRPSVEQLLQMPQMMRHSIGLREDRRDGMNHDESHPSEVKHSRKNIPFLEIPYIQHGFY